MNLKKFMPLIISGAVALVLIALEVFFLLRYQGQYSEVKSELKRAESDVDNLMRRDPFPSDENVRIEKENYAKLSDQVDRVQNAMRSQQVEYSEWDTPTEFQIKLNPNLQELRTMADQLGVGLPQNYHFSFAKYAQGELPDSGDVARLSRQLQMIKTVCEILFKQRIESLEGVERTEFDSDGAAGRIAPPTSAGRRGRRGDFDAPAAAAESDEEGEPRDDQGIYAWEELSVTFNTKEQALWNVLRTLANTELLVSVEDLEFNSGSETLENIKRPEYASVSRASRQPGGFGVIDRSGVERTRVEAGAGEEEGEEKVIPPREERVIAGDSTLNVVMKLKIYRFLDEDKQEGGTQ